MDLSPAIAPGAGGSASSAASGTLSTYAVTAEDEAALTMRARSASAGMVRPGRSGADTAMTRLWSPFHCFASALTSASVMPGRNFTCIWCSQAMPGSDSSVRKFRMYSAASGADSSLSFSASAWSYTRSRFRFSRSSSVAVNPWRSTREASATMASSARAIRSGWAIAESIATSFVRTKMPRSTPAPMNGASARWLNSLSLALNIAAYRWSMMRSRYDRMVACSRIGSLLKIVSDAAGSSGSVAIA